MTKILHNITDMLAEAALLEMGVSMTSPVAKRATDRESLEDTLIEVAFAEAADYDDIHTTILQEHRLKMDIAHPDERQSGDNDRCFRHAA